MKTKLILGTFVTLVLCFVAWRALRSTPSDKSPNSSALTVSTPSKNLRPVEKSRPAAPQPVGRLDQQAKLIQPAAAPIPDTQASVLKGPEEIVVPAPAANEAKATASPSEIGSTAQTERQRVATHNMLIAHASLRRREVADPDSAANKRALEIMVMKAFSQAPRSPGEAAVQR